MAAPRRISLAGRDLRPARWRGWAGRPGFWPALTGLGLGLLALGPGLGPGFLLSYDMVFVPRMPFSAGLLGLTGGPPRAVPSDAVVAVASLAVPAAILQKAILLLIFVLACSGAAALLASGWAATTVKGADEAGKGRWVGGGAPLPARLAAGVGYAWNPFVAERLLIGQWALLLGYAGLPWVIRLLVTGRERIRLPRLLGVMVPAAIGGFAAMSVTALAAVPVALVSSAPGWRLRRLAAVLGGLAVLSLPWLAPALAVGVHTDPRGADAFAARADTPFGRLGSLVMLSGIWNAQTVPRGYGGGASLVWLLVVAAALGGYLLLARPRRLCPGLGRRRAGRPGHRGRRGDPGGPGGAARPGRGVARVRGAAGRPAVPGAARADRGGGARRADRLAGPRGAGGRIPGGGGAGGDGRARAGGAAAWAGLGAGRAAAPGASTRRTGRGRGRSSTATRTRAPRCCCRGPRTAVTRGTTARRCSTRGRGSPPAR